MAAENTYRGMAGGKEGKRNRWVWEGEDEGG
jgi:hypothetical protein